MLTLLKITNALVVTCHEKDFPSMELFIVPQSCAVSAITPVSMSVHAKHLSGCFLYGSNFDTFESSTVICNPANSIPDGYPTYLIFVNSSKLYGVVSLVAVRAIGGRNPCFTEFVQFLAHYSGLF